MEDADRTKTAASFGYDPAKVKGRRFKPLLWLENRSELSTAYIYLVPTLLVLFLTIVFPMGYAIVISLTEIEFVQGSMTYSYVGLDNYMRLFQDDRFPKVMYNTMYFTVLKVLFTLSIGFAIALLIYYGLWGAAFFKRIFLIPWALSNVVNALMWQWMYSGDYGIFNEIMLRLGMIDRYQSWLVNVDTAMTAVLLADIWKAVPYAALLLLAAMQSIPKELHEAAKVDGGGAFVAFHHIIVPHIRPVVMVLLVIETMWALRVFDVIELLTKGGPQDSTMTLNVFAYDQAFRNFEFGYGAAISYVITFLTLIFTIIYMRGLKPER